MDTPERLGQDFHRQLFALVGELHPPDETHDLMVGETLRTAIAEHDPAGAARRYNDWADSHGYARISWLGTFMAPNGQRWEWVDIRDVVVSIGDDYRVTVLKEAVCPSGQA